MAHSNQLVEELEDLAALESDFKPAHENEPDRQRPPQGGKQKSKRMLLALAFGLVIVAATAAWLHYRKYESTDDAQVDGHLHPISARISGTVIRINPKVVDNRYVEAGTLLFELDPNDYQVVLEQAKANLDAREAVVTGSRVGVPITRTTAFSQLRLAGAAKDQAAANVESEQANLVMLQHKLQQDQAVYERAERDRKRFEGLLDSIVSQSEYDARATEARSAQEAVAADRASISAAEKRIAAARGEFAQKQAELDSAGTAPDRVTDAQARLLTSSAQVEQAKADVHAAELNLGYTKVYAPVSGIIGRKTVEVGQHIQPGQTLLSIVPVDDVWITANFKETQLKHMHAGQPVRIYVDTFGRSYDGTVENLAGAAGTLFSLLPPENANGNFVKVVQRLPVRIRLNAGEDPQHLLRPGMSVEPTVKVR
jgi:membrane fusion protein (multidrug efflux system)